ncbi:MAG: ATP-binding protein [Caldilineaceae bacterium]
MEPFVLHLFGLFQAKIGERILHFQSDKAKALLAYLVAEGGGPVRRHQLAEFFWPGYHPDSAQNNLRSTLSTLRKALAPIDLLQTTRQTIRLDLAYPAFWCDLLALQPVAGMAPQEQRPFLEDLDRVDSAPFQAWRRARQQHYQQQRAQGQQPVDQAPADARPPTPPATHNLPLATTSFVGRETLLAALYAHLSAPVTPRLVTLVGPSGGGKTRLAREVATALLPTFADGVWLIELAALTDPTLLPTTIVTALGLHPQPGRPLLTLLLDWLRNKQLVLILDNCEHLLAACAAFADAVLRSCPQVRLLATSREALGMAGEQIYPVVPLSVPPPEADTVPADLLAYEAVRLFVTRATLARPTFRLSAANAPAVAQLCRQLDGIPLALELAAAHVKTLPIQTLVERLTDRFHLLDRGNRTALPRHQTLRASVDWSYALLAAPEQLLLQRLSIFAGNWTLAAAEAVCSDAQPNGLTVDAVFTALLRLVEKSLVSVAEHEDEPCYRMLETIRQYAYEKLCAAHAETALGHRHLAYYLGWVSTLEPLLQQGQRARYLPQLAAAHDNLRAAILWACTHDPEAACRLVGLLLLYWFYGDCMVEGELWSQRVLALPVQAAAPPASITATITAGRALAHLGYLIIQCYKGQFDPAPLAESVRHFEALGDTAHLCDALNWLGFTLTLLGKGAEAAQLFAQHEGLWQQAATPLTLSTILLRWGAVQPDRSVAQQCYAEALAIGQRWQEPVILAEAYYNLSQWALRQQDFAQARRYGEEAVACFRQVGARWLLVRALQQAGDAVGLDGDWATAQRDYTEALHLAQAVGFDIYQAALSARLGYLASREGEFAAAERYIAQSEAFFQALALTTGAILSLLCYAELRRRQGQFDLAVRLLAHATRRPILFVFDRAIGEQTLAALHSQLPATDFTAAWDAGQALTLAEALALARSALGATLEQEKAVLTLRSVSM